MRCLESDPSKRPTPRELLFHPALFEIPTLKLLSVHSLADDIRNYFLFKFIVKRNFYYSLDLKPDRSCISPCYQSSFSDQIFAELDSHREGVKPVIFTYVYKKILYPFFLLLTKIFLFLDTKIVHHLI